MQSDVSHLHRQMEEALDHLENERPGEAKRVLMSALGVTDWEGEVGEPTPFWIMRLTPEEGEMLFKRLNRAKTGASRHRYIMNKERNND